MMSAVANRPKRNWSVHVMAYVLGIVATAVISVMVKDMWEAARPVVQLVDLQVRPIVQPDKAEVLLDRALLSQIERHPYFPDLKALVNVETIKMARILAQDSSQLFVLINDRIDKLIKMAETTSIAVSLDKRRKDFLTLWTESPKQAEYLDSLAKRTLSTYPLPSKYDEHPASYPQLVHTASGTLMLYELDPEAMAQAEAAVAGPVGVYRRVLEDAKRTNKLRRLWAYYEPDVLVAVLKLCKSYIGVMIDKGNEIDMELNRIASEAQPPHLVATVVITNHGVKPIALRSLAVLKLSIPTGDSADNPVVVEMIDAADGRLVVTIDGGESLPVTLRSARTIDEIIKEHEGVLGGNVWKNSRRIEDSRLLKIFNEFSTVLKASVALARAGVDPADARVATTEWKPFGRAARKQLIEALSETGTSGPGH